MTQEARNYKAVPATPYYPRRRGRPATFLGPPRSSGYKNPITWNQGQVHDGLCSVGSLSLLYISLA